MKEIDQNLSQKTLCLTILIKIGLTYSKLINEMLIFLWILFLNKMNSVLDTHAPFKKINKCKLNLIQNPVLPTLQKSISIKRNSNKRKV